MLDAAVVDASAAAVASVTVATVAGEQRELRSCPCGWDHMNSSVARSRCFIAIDPAVWDQPNLAEKMMGTQTVGKKPEPNVSEMTNRLGALRSLQRFFSK